jgi:membrane protein
MIGDSLGSVTLWHVLNWVVSFVLLAIVFAVMFRVLPDVEISWSDVAVGAILTTLLFLLGNYLIGLYLSKSSVASAYGAAGSLVVILLWVYYGSQVLLFGAEFTQVYASHFGQPLVAETAETAPSRPGEHPKAVARGTSTT